MKWLFCIMPIRFQEGLQGWGRNASVGVGGAGMREWRWVGDVGMQGTRAGPRLPRIPASSEGHAGSAAIRGKHRACPAPTGKQALPSPRT